MWNDSRLFSKSLPEPFSLVQHPWLLDQCPSHNNHWMIRALSLEFAISMNKTWPTDFHVYMEARAWSKSENSIHALYVAHLCPLPVISILDFRTVMTVRYDVLFPTGCWEAWHGVRSSSIALKSLDWSRMERRQRTVLQSTDTGRSPALESFSDLSPVLLAGLPFILFNWW